MPHTDDIIIAPSNLLLSVRFLGYDPQQDKFWSLTHALSVALPYNLTEVLMLFPLPPVPVFIRTDFSKGVIFLQLKY